MCSKCKTRMFWVGTGALFAAATTMLFTYTPTEQTMGPIQKIFYLHLPVAISTFLACLVSFAASIAYLAKRDLAWDRLAAAAARVAVAFCSVVLLTGMIWGKSAWGQWWTWSPRLTFSLVLWLLYVVYLMIRASVESAQRRALIAAVYGMIAFLDVPLVYLSVRLMPDIHPVSVELAPAMKLTLFVWFAPVLMALGGAIVALYGRQQRLDCATQLEDIVAPAAPMHWAGGAS
jgi:heme exporter protein C